MNQTTKAHPMPNALARLAVFAGFLPRAALVVLALSAPVIAIAGVVDGPGSVIEHSQKKSNGVGFVLLVSLQR